MTDLHPPRGRPAAGESALITGRIVDAAWSVLLETGPEQFSLDRVATAAHASKQTIYARFSGKVELLWAVLTSQVGLLFAEFSEVSGKGGIEAVIAEVTRRSATSLTAPEVMMLERLIDWIDAAEGGATGSSTRAAVYSEMHTLLAAYLQRAVEDGHVAIEDVETAATFWLDGLIGHVRGVPRGGEQLEEWARTFARYFLRAVSA